MIADATLWDLVVDGRIAIEEIVFAVDTFLATPGTREHPLGSTHILDLAAAVAVHGTAPAIMTDAEADVPSRRIAVRAALLMAKPACRSRR